MLEEIAIDGCITKALGGGQAAGRSPVDRDKLGLKRSGMTDGQGIPRGRVVAPANRHDSPLLAPTLDLLDNLGPLPDDITVNLDADYDSAKSRAALAERGLTGRIAHKGESAGPGHPALVCRAHPRLAEPLPAARPLLRAQIRVIDAFFDLADTIITVRSLIHRSWTTHRWDDRSARRP